MKLEALYNAVIVKPIEAEDSPNTALTNNSFTIAPSATV